MKRSSKRSALTLIAATSLAIIGTGICSQGQTQSQAVRAASSRADETLEMWNLIGNRLIAMVQDFPEDKYDFKLHQGRAHLCRKYSACRRSRLRPDPLGWRVEPRT